MTLGARRPQPLTYCGGRVAADQGNDPNNNADCNASTRASEVHVSEVQVFGQSPTVDGTKVTTG